LIARPFNSLPLNVSIAFAAASGSISIKANPRERPVSLSVTIVADSTDPTSENNSVS
jgi:hypothetical protein